MPWDLTGNSGINPTTNFLGTRDNQPLVIRTNGVERLRVSPDGSLRVGTLLVTPQNPTTEGGEITLLGAGTNPPTTIDNFSGSLRLITQGAERLRVTPDGNVEVTGDIRLLGADCAEDFDVLGDEQLEAGTVMVIDEEGALKPSEQPYDKRVAGVISGGGDYRAGLILDRQEESNSNRMPVALVGKVACKVEARDCPIEVGDLLTTAPTPGYAMKAEDPSKAPGAVIGKALQRLVEGRGLIGVLVSLQ